MKKLVLVCLVVSLGGILSAQTDPQWHWASRAGSAGNDYGYSISRDNAGNLYITGLFLDVAQFGGTHITTVGSNDIFVAKLDPNGNWLWAKRAGGSGDDCGQTVVFRDGYCYLTGYFSGTASFGATSLSSFGSGDIFVARLDTNGNWLWVKRAGGTGHDEGDSVSIDSSGNCFMSGYFNGLAGFGTIALTGSGWDVFVTKLDPDGNWVWASSAGGSGTEGGWSVSVDDNGNSDVCGPFTGTAVFGTTTLHCLGSQDIYVARLDNEGNWLWAKRAGGNYVMGENTDVGCCLALESNGNCYLTGYFYGAAADFGTTILTNHGGYDYFIAQLDIAGNWLWAITGDGIYNDSGWGVCYDEAGNFYVTGVFSGTMNFGATQLTSAGERDVWAAKLSSAVGIDDEVQTPETAMQLYNHPNPFNPETTISYTLPASGMVSLEIYNSRGQLVRRLLNEEQPAGEHALIWNGKDDSGHSVASGLYLCRIACNGKQETRKLLLLK